MLIRAKISPPQVKRGDTLAENISEGFLIVPMSSIRLLGVSTFLIDKVKRSKNPVEKIKAISPMKNNPPPTMKDALIYECRENSL